MKYVGFLMALLITATAVSQVEPDYETVYRSGEERIKSQWGMNVQISSVGFVLGGMYNHKIAPMTFVTTSLDMFWVKGKDERQTFDVITGQPITINAETILMLPLQIMIKRRILAESLSNTMRPFVTAGVGGVAGFYLDGDAPKANLKKDHDASQVTWIATAGFGSDFGKPGGTGYGVDFRYQFLHFAKHLGERRGFPNFQIGFHMNF